jgi:hypothetical protein
MTGEEYAQIAANIQASLVAIITTVAPKAQVLDEDPVNLDTNEWEASLTSAADVDDSGDKRVHTWLVTFAGSDGAPSSTVRSIEPTMPFRVQAWLRHEPGSEAVFRAETLKVQLAIAQAPKLNVPDVVTRHKGLPIECRRLGQFSKTIVHRSDTVIKVELKSIVTY